MARPPLSSPSSLLSHGVTTEAPSETAPPDPALAARHRVPGRAWGPARISIAVSVPAVMNRAGQAGPCYDCLCFWGRRQHGRWPGWATQACLLWAGVDPAWLALGDGVRKG